MNNCSVAVLGATGATGEHVLRSLLANGSEWGVSQINILVRSRKKLLRAFPRLENEGHPSLALRIYEGDSRDTDVVGACLEGVDIIFCCVGRNGSHPGTTLYSDTAAAIVGALEESRRTQAPTEKTLGRLLVVIQLRSASLNPDLASQAPWLVHKFVLFALHHSYSDLRQACALLASSAALGRSRGEPLLHFVFVDPPTLHDADGAAATGYELITTEPQKTALSYADLGAAMCEIAQKAYSGELRDQPIGVTATGRVRTSWGVLAPHLLWGAWGRIAAALDPTANGFLPWF